MEAENCPNHHLETAGLYYPPVHCFKSVLPSTCPSSQDVSRSASPGSQQPTDCKTAGTVQCRHHHTPSLHSAMVLLQLKPSVTVHFNHHQQPTSSHCDKVTCHTVTLSHCHTVTVIVRFNGITQFFSPWVHSRNVDKKIYIF